MKPEKDEDKLPSAWLIAGGVVLLWVASIVALSFLFDDWTKSGPFGDSFGAVNALFSGLALAGVVYAILLQRTELSLQREELADTRAELRRSADAQERAEVLARDNFLLAAMTAALNAETAKLEKATGGTAATEKLLKSVNEYQEMITQFAEKTKSERGW